MEDMEMEAEEEDDSMDAEEADEAEEEESNAVEELLTRVALKQAEDEDSAPGIVDLGHFWDQDFMREAWEFRPDVDVKAKGFMYDAIDAKTAGVADGSVPYLDDEEEKEREDVSRMRDEFGLNRMWEAVWAIS